MTDNTEEFCKSCRCWYPYDDRRPDLGECMARPPVVVAKWLPDDWDADCLLARDHAGVRPVTNAEDWCKEWVQS